MDSPATKRRTTTFDFPPYNHHHHHTGLLLSTAFTVDACTWKEMKGKKGKNPLVCHIAARIATNLSRDFSVPFYYHSFGSISSPQFLQHTLEWMFSKVSTNL